MKKPYQPIVLFLLLGILPFILALRLSRMQPGIFTPYFGKIPPLQGMLLTLLTGFTAFLPLSTGAWAYVPKQREIRKWVGYLLFAAGFALPSVIKDLLGAFPENINVQIPEALLFYPAIGYVADIFFH